MHSHLIWGIATLFIFLVVIVEQQKLGAIVIILIAYMYTFISMVSVIPFLLYYICFDYIYFLSCIFTFYFLK